MSSGRLSREDITTQFGIINNAIKLIQQKELKLVQDTSPQLGGDLDLNDFKIKGNLTHIDGTHTAEKIVITGRESLVCNGAITVGSYNQAEINAFSGDKPRTGMLIFNTTVTAHQFHNGTQWVTLDGGGSSDLISDTSPQLGGDLDVSGHDIVTTSNADIDLDPHGTGSVVFKGNTTRGSGSFKLNCENNSHGITIKGPPHSAAASYTLTLPNNDGDADQVLKTDGSGTLAWVDSISPSPTFSSLEYTNPGETALDTVGGQITINGNNFVTGTTCTIDGTVPSTITINNVTQMTVLAPAKPAGSYALVISNTTGGSATIPSAVSYNGAPQFTHGAGTLGTVDEGTVVNLSVVATEPDGGTITHSVISGSLPSGLSLDASTGAITGTASDVSANTTSNFTIKAQDKENQSTTRTYSITVNNVNVADHFNIVLYTGTGVSGLQVTGVGFKPDFVWLKERNSVENHNLYDSSRGVQKFLASNNTNQEGTGTQRLQSFDNDGFTLGNDNECNESGVKYVAWCWKANGGNKSTNNDGSIQSEVQANNTLGFSIVQFTGSGSNATVGHGLSSAPDYIIMTNRTRPGYGWYVYNSASGPTKNMVLNTQDAEATNATAWNNGATTATTFSLGTETGTNSGSFPYIAYCFTNTPGFSKAGSYTGNASDDGPVVNLGFSPAFLMIKTTVTDSWFMVDNKRETVNPRGDRLFADSDAVETSEPGAQIDFLTAGFKIRGSGGGQGQVNSSGTTYIYLAFAAALPSTTPTLANSFKTILYTGTGAANRAVTGVGFSPGLVWMKGRSQVDNHYWLDEVRGVQSRIYSNTNGADYGADSNRFTSFDSDGFTLGSDSSVNMSTETYVAWIWKGGGSIPTIIQSTTDVDAKAVYKFEDNAYDETGNYHGTASNVTYNSSGNFNKGAEFNGINSVISSTGSGAVGMSGNPVFTISFWVNPTNTNGTPIMFGNNSGGQAFLTFISANNKLNFGWWGNSFGDSTASVPNNTWTHITIVNNAGDVQLYINGAADLSFSTTYTIVNTDFYIGAARNQQFFSGKIDQVRIYDKALTAVSITNLYNETTSQNSTLNIGTKYPSSMQATVSANTNAGFSIVKFKNESPGSDARVPHGLSSAPDMIILKRLDGVENWYVYHSAMGITKYMRLDTNAGEAAATNLFSTVNSTVFNPSFTGAAGQEIIAYCFRSISGYSKFGSYAGSGSNNNAVTLGFQPNFVLVKRSNSTGGWLVYDSERSGSNPINDRLEANNDQAEQINSGDKWLNFNSNNFEANGSDSELNASGGTYIYMAFKIN